MGERSPEVSGRKLRVLLALGTVCAAVALLFVALDPTASEYEITIYDSYPLAFWLLALFAVYVGQIVVFESAASDDRRRYWKWGFALLVCVNVVLLFLPAFRYNLYLSADMLSHVGHVREIRALGSVPETNYYPNVHLLALAFTSITGVALPKATNVLTPLMTVFYFGFVYVLLRRLFADRRKLLFVLPFTTLLLFQTQHAIFMPSWFAFLLVPFALALLVRSYENATTYRFTFLLLLTTVSLVFYHPAVTIFFIGMLVLLKAASTTGRRLVERRPSSGTTPLVVALLAFVLFFSWYYSFEGIVGSTLSVVYVILGVTAGSSRFSNLAGVAQRTTPDLLDVALVGVHNYGLYGAVVGMALVFAGYHAYLWLFEDRTYDTVETFLAVVLVAFTAGAAVAFFVDVVLFYYRILRYALFAGAILVGLGFYTLSSRVDAERFAGYVRPVIYASLFALAFLSIFTLYGSPLSSDQNHQITQAEIDGMEWLFENRNESLAIDQSGISQYRLHTYLYPGEPLGENVRWRGDVPPPPMHFEYANASNEALYGGSAEHRRYLVVSEYGRQRNPRFYPKYPEFWRHAPADFQRLERDPSFLHVYDDGSLDAYVVRGVATRTNESDSPAQVTRARFAG